MMGAPSLKLSMSISLARTASRVPAFTLSWSAGLRSLSQYLSRPAGRRSGDGPPVPPLLRLLAL
eukprot:5465664-Pyramimonas_sp.AAC.1